MYINPELLKKSPETAKVEVELRVKVPKGRANLNHKPIIYKKRPPLDRLISAYRDRVAGNKLDQQVNDVRNLEF